MQGQGHQGREPAVGVGRATPSHALSELLIDDAIEIAMAYDKRPDAAPRDIRAAALALAEEVVRLRAVVTG